MQRNHSDKALAGPAPLLGRAEFLADAAAAERWREASLAPDERAGQVTPGERARLDEAAAALAAASERREAAGAALAAARTALARLHGTTLHRGPGGVLDERRVGTDDEIAAATRAVRDAEEAARQAADDEERVLRRFNAENAAVGRACTARRQRVQAQESFEAWAAAHPEASERERGEAREMYGLARTGLFQWIQSRIGGGA